MTQITNNLDEAGSDEKARLTKVIDFLPYGHRPQDGKNSRVRFFAVWFIIKQMIVEPARVFFKFAGA